MKQVEREIRDRILAMLETSVKTTLLARYTVGRGIIALQQMRGDVKPNDGRPMYAPARDIIAGWINDAGYEGLSDATMQQCTYIALRLSQAHINVLADAGMCFCQCYAMVVGWKDTPSNIRRYVSEVKAGIHKRKSFGRFTRERKERKPKPKPPEIIDSGGDKYREPDRSVVIDLDAPVDEIRNKIANVLTRLPDAVVDDIIRSIAHVRDTRARAKTG